MRVYTKRSNPPYTMIGQNVAKIIESKDPEYPKDSIVLTKSGWVKAGMLELNSEEFVTYIHNFKNNSRHCTDIWIPWRFWNKSQSTC